MYAKEVDVVRLRREAKALLDFLWSLSPADDSIGLRSKVIPVCERALDGTLQIPLDVRDKPIDIPRLMDFGYELPKGFQDLYASFAVTATGARADVEHPVHKDGKVWGWMEFED